MDIRTLLISTLTAVVGNLSLKKGMVAVGKIDFARQNFLPTLFKTFTQPFVIFGLAVYVLSMLFWLKVLSIWELSKAYPILVGASFALVTISSYFFFKETLTTLKIIGIIVIFLGVLIIAKG